MTEEDIRNTIISYRETNDQYYLDRILTQYYHFIVKAASKLYRKYTTLRDIFDISDFISYGVIGLINSINKFDLNKNVKFLTYAKYRINGEIIDGIRRFTKIPRRIRKDINKYVEFLEFFISKYDRRPTEKEIEDNTGIPHKRMMYVYKLINTYSVRIEDFQDLKYSYPVDIVSNYENKDLKNRLLKLVRELIDIERKVIILSYFHNMKLVDIADVLQTSPSYISQVRTRALKKLRIKANAQNMQIFL